MFVDKGSVFSKRLVSLCDYVVVFHISCEVDDFVCNLPIYHFAVGRFNEAVLVNPGKCTQRPDQTNVGSLWSLDGTHSPVVGVVDVPDFKAGPFSTEAPWAQSAEPSFMGELRQRVGLIHELGQLAAAEKFFDGCHSRPGIDQFLRGDGLCI